jgi:hypothetical protein
MIQINLAVVWARAQPEQNNVQKNDVAFGGTRTHALKEDYDLNVAP